MSTSIPEEAMPLVRESIEREIALFESKIALVEEEISRFEKKHGLGDEQDYFEWWGLLQGLKKLKQRLEISRSVISS